MIARGDVLLRQRGDGHWRFALAVNLREPRPEAIERDQRVLDIHRRAAPNERADIVGSAFGGASHQALDHGGRSKHRHARPGIEQREHFLGFEPATLRYHLHAEPRDMRHDVKTGTVAHRGRMQDGVARRHRIDLQRISMARRRQIPMREHRAFRPSGRARCVEQPGEIVRRARHDINRISRKQLRHSRRCRW